MTACERIDKNKLWTIKDIMKHTGWGYSKIAKLCRAGNIPYIPGKPHKFIPSEVKTALVRLQVGIGYDGQNTRRNTAI